MPEAVWGDSIQVNSLKSTDQIQNKNSDQDVDKWHFKLQPYALIPVSIYGNSTVKDRTLNYSLGLGSFLDVLRVAALGNVEVWHNNLGFIVSANYVSLNGGGIKGSHSPLNGTLNSSLTFSQGIYDFALSYHLGAPAMYSLPEKPSNKSFPQFWFEPIAGVRMNSLNVSIDSTLNLGLIDASFQKAVSAGRTEFEPLLGAKMGIQVADPVTLWVKGTVSGFGTTGTTDSSWSVILAADWWVSRTISLQLGYAFSQLNYQNASGSSSFGLKENLNGPYLSAIFNF